ncbi:DNA-binding transcriptional regulator, MarR family [Paenibacillus sp. UNCCL117]|uniref:MarR family winged helix-turn-helix transcriptional regulator n=1 Tax=unclassified Paenibacillus TaxID=185978 RepID=UPI00088B3E9C|nr:MULTISPECIES: MarR family transcriptional regulator [unclassified Paenibacillus]SDD71403.1 DNA-binding transcriptional regulator, MarR family [Paenibacillus sp. cl123]SFW45529.1 DNA-binding transcriptional regulator, MarR family [Paenibacillus sp. UNCCL117]
MTKREPYIERFEQAFFTLFRKLGPELGLPPHIALTGPQTMMLYKLRTMGPCPGGKLAQQMEVTPSAITVMIDRLVAQGLVERTHDEHDRRVVLLSITEQGMDTLQQIRAVRDETIKKYLSYIEPDELELFLSTFEKIVSQSAE